MTACPDGTDTELQYLVSGREIKSKAGAKLKKKNGTSTHQIFWSEKFWWDWRVKVKKKMWVKLQSSGNLLD